MSVPLARTPIFMRSRLLLTALFLFSSCFLASVSAYAVDCNNDGVGLRTQADVDNFQADYGPCDTITGSLQIKAEGATLVNVFTNLDGLSDIISITGDLAILQSSVASLTGLSNLLTIGGSLRIESQLAGSFSDLTGLSSLGSLIELNIFDTNYLTSLSGLDSLSSLGTLTIYNARVLTSLSGMNSLVSLDALDISGCPLLPSLSGLSEGVAVANQAEGLIAKQAAVPASLNMIKNISIQRMDKLQNLDGLSAIIGIQSLNVEGNPILTSISALAGSTFNDNHDHPAFAETVPGLVISKL